MNTATTPPRAAIGEDQAPDAGASTADTRSTDVGFQSDPQPLRRSTTDRMLAGVAAGVASYLGADVTLVRIAFVVLTIVGGAGLPLYLAGWLLIPEAGSDQPIAAEFIRSIQSRSN